MRRFTTISAPVLTAGHTRTTAISSRRQTMVYSADYDLVGLSRVSSGRKTVSSFNKSTSGMFSLFL